MLLFSFTKGTFAHAVLLEANPPLNSQLKDSPPEIRYIFNERIEKELYYIRVFNEEGELVTNNQAEISEDQRGISLMLPPLDEGNYTVTYHILSGDGHPVEQSSILTIGTPSKQPSPWYMNNVINQDHHSGISVDRMLFYCSLLFLVGWLGWGIFFSFTNQSNQSTYENWLQKFRHFFLISLIITSIIQVSSLLKGWDIASLIPLLLRSLWGWTWIVSLGLAVLSYLILRKSKWIDAAWILLLLTVEGISGHAITFTPSYLTVIVDFVHLITAAAWVGGLWFFILFWKHASEEMLRFYPLFSRVAFISLIVLTITGIFTTILFLPEWSYLTKTAWGILLLIKTLLVLVVIIVASFIRASWKKNQLDRLPSLFRMDFTLMIFILIIVGALTYLNPLPENKPLYWSEMGRSAQVITQITPKVPGDNQISVQVVMTEEELKVKRVTVSLINLDGKIAPLKVPIEPVSSESSLGTTFMVKGPYLPFAGKWKVEVRVLDSNDDERVYAKSFEVY